MNEFFERCGQGFGGGCSGYFVGILDFRGRDRSGREMTSVTLIFTDHVGA